MSNKVKDISTRKWTYYFFNDIINIKKLDLNNVKIDEKSYKNIFMYYVGYVTIKDSKYVKIYSVNPLYLIFDKVNGYFGEINGNKYFGKIRDLIRSITENQMIMMKIIWKLNLFQMMNYL